MADDLEDEWWLKSSEAENHETQDNNFCVCSSPEDTATSYLRTILPKWKKLTKSELPPGSPLLLIITSSAIRAVQLNREIQDFKGEEAKCAKLFAKHFKLEEQKKYLAKQICHMGIGTPNRLQALLKDNSLHLKNVKTIVVDWNWRDIKSKRLIDIPEIKKDFMMLLQTFLIPHVHNTKCKIGLL
ncbi:hypothetical protein KUTeg_007042 [Tegillarca granosa]|uniref:Protein CMSS1 n=1 Tax=Tegillarca granosa TaxID=220873 RepID=A0ABQ9FG98_TEGGR|nr:hypothetical protein KUTeg_007042 [Tegillarca granosa]